MTCANHPEAAAAAYCRTCGKPLCLECKREAEGTIFCAEHVPAQSTAAPSGTARIIPPVADSSPYAGSISEKGKPVPILAFFLGFIPGVGAIYNGQYAKGLIHAVVFGILVSVLDRHSDTAGPIVGVLLSAWIFYMAFEALHTAKALRDGTRPDEVSSLVQMDSTSRRFPAGALILIGIGALLLLDTTNLISIDRLIHFWPVGLILIGAYMLYERLGSGARLTSEVRDEIR